MAAASAVRPRGRGGRRGRSQSPVGRTRPRGGREERRPALGLVVPLPPDDLQPLIVRRDAEQRLLDLVVGEAVVLSVSQGPELRRIFRAARLHLPHTATCAETDEQRGAPAYVFHVGVPHRHGNLCTGQRPADLEKLVKQSSAPPLLPGRSDGTKERTPRPDRPTCCRAWKGRRGTTPHPRRTRHGTDPSRRP